MLEQQHLNLDQYLSMTKKTHEEYHEELRPDAEKRVKRELVLEQLAVEEDIKVEVNEIEALFNAYEQIGQPLPRTEDQIRSLMISFRREKALSRLIELTTDADEDEDENAAIEDEAVTESAEEAAAFANAAAAAAIGEASTAEGSEATQASDQKTETVE
jgi:trigger factor